MMQIDFKIDRSLVRGLDYYTNFVFEINSKDEKLAGQPTLIGGGRYANLVKELDGPDCSCVGFALGIERLLLVLEYEKIKIADPINTEIVIASLSEKTNSAAIVMISLLRSNGISAVCKFDTYKLTKHFDYATSLSAKYVIILGEKELQDQKVTIKNQKTLKQETIAFDKIVDFIRNQK
jgi:histidyl-tRNA synthetase